MARSSRFASHERAMKVVETSLSGVLLIEPRVFRDARGYFFEDYRANAYGAAGVPGPFVQGNVSCSSRGVLRGLHFQHPAGQAKLVQVLWGEVFDVAVDVRRGSPNFGRWIGQYLSSETHIQMLVPAGFAHGFVVTSEHAVFAYKCTRYYEPATEHVVRWDDASLGITWPVPNPTLSPRDAQAPTLASMDPALLPAFE